MQQPRPLWFLLDLYGWIVLIMSIVTAFIIQQWWMLLIGVIGYLVALLVDLAGGRALGRTGSMRLARAEQENRELKAEQARLLGALRDRDAKSVGEKNEQTGKESTTQGDKESGIQEEA
jgi:ABC-type multidrug transport system fused ATPase/permease subunit